MTATRGDIERWLAEAEANGSAYLIVGLDPMDHDNFPIYCKDADECWDKIDDLSRTGNLYDEVYDMSLPIAAQLSERRAYHFPPAQTERTRRLRMGH